MVRRYAAGLSGNPSTLETHDMTRKEAEQRVRMFNALASLGIHRDDAEALRRISMTLTRWHEAECGDSNAVASWAIERDGDEPDSKPFMVCHPHRGTTTRTPVPDREIGAKRRLAAIMARHPTLAAYVQTDPRGCALYILRPGDVPEGQLAECHYSRGIAVY